MQAYQVMLTQILDIKTIEDPWRQLEKKANTCIFLSWTWMASWLESFKPKVYLLQINFKGQLVGLCFAVFKKEHRHKLIHSRCLYLNQTGVADEDQIWSEFNGFLIDTHHEQEALKAAFDFLKSCTHTEKNIRWDEIVTGVMTKERCALYQKKSQLSSHIRWQAEGYKVELDLLRKANLTYLESLSRNTRYQVNRTRKKLEQTSPITLNRAQSMEQALAFLDDLAPLHIKRWQNSEEGSGFSNPKFVLFHKNLIRRAWANNQVDLIKISNGQGLLCYFYNFIYNNEIYFYLSAIEYGSTDKNLQPGLLCHALCIQFYLDQGRLSYDFLGGTARYKKSLSNSQYQLMVLSLQKTTPLLLLERLGRYLKNTAKPKD